MSSFIPQNSSSPIAVLDGDLSVQDAADYSGYNVQYLRRLVQAGTITGRKIGQVWLVNLASLDTYLKSVQRTDDRRFSPRVYQPRVSAPVDIEAIVSPLLPRTIQLDPTQEL